MTGVPGKTDTLKGAFRTISAFQPGEADPYQLLPFRFSRLDNARYLITNFAGDYLLLAREDVHRLARKDVPIGSDLYNILKRKHFLIDAESSVPIDLLAAQYRTKMAPVADFTMLHLFIVTLRCNQRCVYCQASRQAEDQRQYDMTTLVADRAVGVMFRSPSPTLKVEFQGGEPLLNFDVVRHVVDTTEERNAQEGRRIEFVICSNLSALTDEILDSCAGRDIFFSTSLDGPRELHNANRPKPHGDGYASTTAGIKRIQEALGPDRVSAIMTTTGASLAQPRAIIDEYLRQGLGSIFLRAINPYGLASETASYTVDEWLDFYKTALGYILDLNQKGIPFREAYSAIVLQKILTPYGTSFVDLRSPAGIGIQVMAYNFDGAVYVSDEGRMLGAMGDQAFRLGNLMQDSYESIMLSDALIRPLEQSMTECVPGCADCAFQPYCGSDPVRHHRTQKDVVGYKPTSEFCRRTMGIMKHLIGLLQDDPRASAVLRTWI